MTSLSFSAGDVVCDKTGIKYHSEAGFDEYEYPDHRAMLRGTVSLTRHKKRRGVFECKCGELFVARLDSVRTGARKSCGCAPRGMAKK